MLNFLHLNLQSIDIYIFESWNSPLNFEMDGKTASFRMSYCQYQLKVKRH